MTKIIYLDAGHGGKDGGAAGNGIKEKDIVLDICKRIESGLKVYDDVKIIMSRSTDIYRSLDERTREANLANADILLSVHINAATSTAAKGWEVYTYPNAGSATTAFSNMLHAEIMRSMGSGITDRGKKTKDLHMLRESKMIAALTENLFISNASDADKLKDPNFRQRIADGHVIALEKYLGLSRSAQPPPQPTQPNGSEKFYIVQVGAFAEKKNAEALAADLRKQGYRPFIKYE